jgi:hypothetical protein
MNVRYFIRAHPTVLTNYTVFGLSKITEKPTTCLLATESCEAMSQYDTVKPSSPEKSPWQRLLLCWGNRYVCVSSPEDYVITVGETTRVRDFVRMVFAELGIEVEFSGQGVDGKGFVASCSHSDYQLDIGKQVIAVDPKYFFPTEVDILIGDPTKSNEKLGMTPKYALVGLVHEMVVADVARAKREILLKESGLLDAQKSLFSQLSHLGKPVCM